MTNIRPMLKKGDLCRYHKKVYQNRRPSTQRELSKVQFVVLQILQGNGIDGDSKIEVIRMDHDPMDNVCKQLIVRRHLWFTGYNTQSGLTNKLPNKQVVKQLIQKSSDKNDGRSHCMQCSEPTKMISGFISSFNICQNKECSMFGY